MSKGPTDDAFMRWAKERGVPPTENALLSWAEELGLDPTWQLPQFPEHVKGISRQFAAELYRRWRVRVGLPTSSAPRLPRYGFPWEK